MENETMSQIECNEIDDSLSVTTNNLSIVNTEWKSEHEKILVEWADKSMCYRWLHGRSHQQYSSLNAWYTIPVIIMSTLTGTANFAQDRFPDNIKELAQMLIGTVNIFAGILTTIQQFLKIGELNEAHRVSSISWDKFYRNIKVELAKSRDERMDVTHMLKMCKEEYDRLMETSPSINDTVIKDFQITFPSNNNDTDCIIGGNAKIDIKKPEICDELISTSEILYQEDKNYEQIKLNEARLQSTKRKQRLIERQETEINNFIDRFHHMHNRKPLTGEIIDNLQDKISISILNVLIKKIYDNDNKSDNNV
tara:strand:+ start:3688 stop:4614 length:927 start_codon:yes stop_codon:yes gene_type:complete